MNIQHTPGPWHLNSNIVCANVPAGTVSVETPIADVCVTGAERWREEEEANARLIANAPELLEVLEKIQVAAELAIHGGDNGLYRFCELVMMNTRPVINKAKGL